MRKTMIRKKKRAYFANNPKAASSAQYTSSKGEERGLRRIQNYTKHTQANTIQKQAQLDDPISIHRFKETSKQQKYQ